MDIIEYKNGKVYDEVWETHLDEKGMVICDKVVSSIEKKSDEQLKIEELEARLSTLENK